ncbi:BT4734/BF3469 family protein [Empedobacter falsenii]
MTSVSIFQNFNNPVQTITLKDLISNIKTGTYQDDVNTIRMAIGMGKPERADELKKKLLAFTPSATYSGGRKKEFIQEYNQIIHLDFDNIDEEDLIQITTQTASIPYTLACFKSPSGNGLKVFIQVDSLVQHHDLAYKQVQEYYEKQLGINADPKCKDVTRLCFVSFDENAYYNPLATIFAVNTNVEEKAVNQFVQMTSNNTDDVFQYCVDFTNKITQFDKGNRNNYVYQLACNLNRKGVNQLDAEQFILQNFYHENQKEFIKSIESAYRNQAHEFGKFAKTANFVNLQKDSPPDKKPVYDEVDYLKTTPKIPAHIVNYLPELLIEGCEAFKDNERKRDVFLTAGLTILSGCLPNVTGIYHQERVYPHLFSFIIAPAASGKGVLKNAKRLGDKIHERFVNKSNEAKKAFEIENAEYKTLLAKRKKDDAIPEKPVEPKFNLLFLPADTSQAMMMKMLQDNNGKGIICETEADAMSGANKQDWGNYSHIMRAAFHHEKISAARKTNNELLEIPNPQLAVSLSGTPAQVLDIPLNFPV